MKEPTTEKDKTLPLLIEPTFENIDIGKFKGEINKIKELLVHLIPAPEDLDTIIKLFPYPDGKIALLIDTNTHGTKDKKNRLYFKLPNCSTICGTLDCKALIDYDYQNERYCHKHFSFHFEPVSDEFRMFRVDFEPIQETPLHAHNDGYHKTNEFHLAYPQDTDLNLYYIDFCTIINLIAKYLQTPNQYPLENGIEYNKITEKIRSRYETH